ncbi:hypothetical protein [Aquamicrobium sp. LC103]|uniref:hypothetical protein n=1 Tax=Aquamicrobium sp. LC103 TaxID=1120658 RepID=UPI00109D16A3|nr:hypothetical protein [Aquamicrobium sp. LC103]TKT69262.1 hypothetical protein XW59_028435 [Aquamicrobium sp. LC103]
MKERDLARLRDLRRLREQRASEKVARHRVATDRAAAQAKQAAEAVADQLHQVAADEQASLGALTGQAVSVRDLHVIQNRFERMAQEVDRRRRLHEEALAVQEECGKELAEAREHHALRLNDVSKLDSALRQLRSRNMHRAMAVQELAAEEELVPSARGGGNP